MREGGGHHKRQAQAFLSLCNEKSTSSSVLPWLADERLAARDIPDVFDAPDDGAGAQQDPSAACDMVC